MAEVVVGPLASGSASLPRKRESRRPTVPGGAAAPRRGGPDRGGHSPGGGRPAAPCTGAGRGALPPTPSSSPVIPQPHRSVLARGETLDLVGQLPDRAPAAAVDHPWYRAVAA